MKKPLIFIILFSLLSFSSISKAFAAWEGPIKVFSANWGKHDGQLGHKSEVEAGDTSELFPMRILVTDDNRIIIGDIVNDRIVITKNGRFYKTFRPSALEPNATMSWKMQWTTLSGSRFLLKIGAKYQIYNTEGALLKTFEGISKYIEEILSLPDDSIMVHASNPNSYYHYTSDGKLLKTFAVEPREVTKIHEQRRKIVESVVLPKASDVTGRDETKIGQPVIAPNGDVYVWGKTPLNYSIKKWVRSASDKNHSLE
jgi:hypothetical protein